MSWRRSTAHDRSLSDVTALLQLRLLLPDAQLNELLPTAPPADLARRFCLHRMNDTLERRTASALRELQRLQVRVVTVADAEYPERLTRLEQHKPPMLFYRGNYALVDTRTVAIVGTRRSTEYGNSVAEMLAGDFARYGVSVISGLALGVDMHAHRGALQMGGATIAVLGCGIDVFYPQRNARLQERIASEGLLLSEFAPGLPAMQHHFLQRNRLIALLASGVIVVEAKHKSGTRNTVEWAGNYGVTVFAVPGPIGREASTGTNALIQDGACLVTCVRDVLEELHWPLQPVLATSSDPAPGHAHAGGAAAAIYGTLGAVGMQIDEIARAVSCTTADALVVLAELELDGLVQQLPGKRFARARVQDES